MIADTEWTVAEAERLLGVCGNNTTRKINELGERIFAVLLADLRKLAPSQQPHRIVDAVMPLLIYGGRLANGDPDGTRQWVRRIVEQRLAAQENERSRPG